MKLQAPDCTSSLFFASRAEAIADMKPPQTRHDHSCIICAENCSSCSSSKLNPALAAYLRCTVAGCGHNPRQRGQKTCVAMWAVCTCSQSCHFWTLGCTLAFVHRYEVVKPKQQQIQLGQSTNSA